MAYEDKERWNNKHNRKAHGTGRTNVSGTVYVFYGRVVDLLPENAKILDVGCGNGIDTEMLGNAGYNTIGLDISDVVLHEAKSARVACVQGDMDALPFHDSGFDAVYSVNVLVLKERRIEKPVAEIHRVLKRGGLAYLAIHENIVCAVPEPTETPYLPRSYLDSLLSERFELLNESRTEFTGRDTPEYGHWTENAGIRKHGYEGEHTHFRPCFFLRKR